MFNICITGSQKSGKSNLINLFLNLYEGEVHGFKSIRRFENGKISGFSIVPFLNSKIDLNLQFDIADIQNNEKIIHSNSFEDFAILHFNIPDSGLVVMDEIGRFESNSPIFLSKVKKCFDDENINVLSVVKKEDIDFVNSLISRDDVIVLDLDMVGIDFAIQAICTCFEMKIDYKASCVITDSFFREDKKTSMSPSYEVSDDLVLSSFNHIDFKILPVVVTRNLEVFYKCQSKGFVCFINDDKYLVENINFALKKVLSLGAYNMDFAAFMNFYSFYLSPEDLGRFFVSGEKNEVAFYSLDSSCLFTISSRYFDSLLALHNDMELAKLIDEFI